MKFSNYKVSNNKFKIQILLQVKEAFSNHEIGLSILNSTCISTLKQMNFKLFETFSLMLWNIKEFSKLFGISHCCLGNQSRNSSYG